MELLLQALVQGIMIGSLYALITLGMAIVYNVTGIMNFSHGDFMTISMFLGLSLFTSLGLDPYVSMFISFPVLVIIGMLVFRLVIRPIIDKDHLMVIQMTLGIVFMIQSLVLIVYGGEFQRVPSFAKASVISIGDVLQLRTPMVIAFGVAVVLSLVLWWILKHTDFGRSIRAINQNPHAAALIGVNVRRVQTLTFGLGIGFVALAGSLLLPLTPIHPNMGLHYTVIALIVFVMGSMGNFVGTLLSGLIIGVVESIGTVYISGNLGLMIPYLLFIVVLLFRPQGIMGGR